MPRHILVASGSLAGLLGIVMLLAMLEKAILPGIIMSGDLGGIVARAGLDLGVGCLDCVGGVVEVLVAGVVLVVAQGWARV